MPSLSKDEINNYWSIFQGQDPDNGLLSGDKMLILLKNSQLEDRILEKVWDLADIDLDGNMDFEEFCIAMRLTYDSLEKGPAAVPDQLPDWLVPASKRHLVTARQALASPLSVAPGQNSDDEEDLRLSNDFQWYISPSDRRKYEAIYQANADGLGRVSFESLRELYNTLQNVPDTDVSSAWNLVNPRQDEKIDKEQSLVFLHILNQRSLGKRLPRSVPASLRATFNKSKPSFDVEGPQAQLAQNEEPKMFGEGYLAKLGLKTGSSKAESDPTPQNSDPEWERVRLERELQDLEERIAATERNQKREAEQNTLSVAKHELEMLLAYKQTKLRAARLGNTSDSGELATARSEVTMVVEQVNALKEHLGRREEQLRELQHSIDAL